ncbi:CD109 antigen-like [Corticium candelabrum]|uniref:CD109 antigen-like n=1 Tax=Corticium candelabrum TaxID=121492 RepID=UPI002E26BDF7|nr:CD109 antigen-like [Corticium candelabrum]
MSAELDPSDFTEGPCYHVLAEDRSCSNRLPELYTKDECCNLKKKQLSVGWGELCEPCPRASENREGEDTGGRRGFQENYFRIRLPSNSIPGSANVSVSVTGKYLEGTIPIQYNVRNMLKIPGGPGEENMIKFGPNVAVIKYLKHSRRLNKAETSRRLFLIRRSYQHQLNFRTSEGGFATSKRHVTVTWLTAFVLRTMCGALDLIFIDPRVITGAQNFLIKRQNTSGEFYESGLVKDYIRGRHRQTPASLTSYVVVSLLECCHQPKYRIPQDVKDGICEAVAFLENEVTAGRVTDEHTKAVVYYALVLACTNCTTCNCSEEARSTLLNELMRSSIQRYGMTYWVGNSTQLTPPRAESIEITSYMLCAYIAQNNVDCARPIAKWVNTARSGRGAFRTTQDTTIALKCLADFASYLTQDRNMRVTVTDLDDSFERVVTIDNNNRDVDQQLYIPITDGVIKVKTEGTGLGLVQVQVSYNVPDLEAEDCSFDFTVSAKFGDKKSKDLLIKACAKYI